MLPHQIHAYYLWIVKQPHRNHTVAKAAADYHLGAIHIIFTCCIFWKKSLIRRHYPADKWKSELSTVGMSGKHEINTDAGIPDKVLWLMCKNDRELFFPRVFIISGLFLLFSLIIPNTFVTKQRL